MNISIGARTDVGGRSNNEDCLAVLDKERVPIRADAVLVIADGMGGRSHGEEASAIAVKIVRETLMDLLNSSSVKPLPPAEDILSAAMRRANSAIFDISQESPELPGMGTTCTVALLSEGVCTLAHVGDSRAYLLRDDTITALTTDHTYVAEQVKAGNMSSESARKSRFKNVITRAIGIAPTVEPEFTTVPLLDGDTLLFCTDGLYNVLDESRILEVNDGSDSATAAAAALLETARKRGLRDNVTVIVVRIASDVLSATSARPSPPAEEIVCPAVEEVSTLSQIPVETVPKSLDEPVVKPNASTGFRYVVLCIVFAALGALLCFGVLFERGYIKGITPHVPAAKPQPGKVEHPAVVSYFGLQYAAPTQLFYKPVRPDFLQLSDNGVYVALLQSGAVVHLNSLGQVDGHLSSVGPFSVESGSTDYFAVDKSGDLYRSDKASGTITVFGRQTNQKRVIAGRLANPAAIAVSDAGTIYVIVGEQVYIIREMTTGKQ